jgi:hypothetical protein
VIGGEFGRAGTIWASAEDLGLKNPEARSENRASYPFPRRRFNGREPELWETRAPVTPWAERRLASGPRSRTQAQGEARPANDRRNRAENHCPAASTRRRNYEIAGRRERLAAAPRKVARSRGRKRLGNPVVAPRGCRARGDGDRERERERADETAAAERSCVEAVARVSSESGTRAKCAKCGNRMRGTVRRTPGHFYYFQLVRVASAPLDP